MEARRTVGRNAKPGGEDGSILIAILVIMTLSAVVIGSSLGTLIETEVAGDFANANAAFVVAESGLMHAFASFEKVKEEDRAAEGYTEELRGKDGKPDTVDDGYIFGVDFDKKTNVMTPEVEELGKGSYFVQVLDNDDGDGDPLTDSDGIVTVSSTAMWATRRATVAADVGVDAAKYDYEGVIVDGDLDTSGNHVSFVGGRTAVHANGNLSTKAAILDGGATATGKLKLQAKDPSVEGQELDNSEVKVYEEAHSEVPEIEMEDVDPDDFEELVDYFLEGDGKIKDADGDEVFDADEDGPWNGWEYGGKKWKLKGDPESSDPMTLFIDGDVDINGNNDPVNWSLLVDGDVKISGSFETFGASPYALIAKGSVQISGKAVLRGSVLIGEEAKFSGHAEIYGSLGIKDKDQQGAKFSGQVLVSTPAGASVVVGKRSGGVGIINWHLRRTEEY